MKPSRFLANVAVLTMALLSTRALAAPTLTPIYSFGQSPGNPTTGVIQGSDGDLYGFTTSETNNANVFKMTTNGGSYTVLQQFTGNGFQGSALLQGQNGNLYGLTQYSATSINCTLFTMGDDGSNYTVLQSFPGGQIGNALVQGSDGTIYGTIKNSGNTGADGTLFRIAPDGSSFETLHTFATGTGAPAGLTFGSDGNLYGTTALASQAVGGTVFKIAPDGSAFETLHTFTKSDGLNPAQVLIEASNGFLYGTTGSLYGTQPTAYQIALDGSQFKTIYASFPSNVLPYSGLLEANDGLLFGTDVSFTGSAGSFYSLEDGGTGYQSLFSFSGANGTFADDVSGLIQGADGRIYGTTEDGGTNNYGTVFAVDDGLPASPANASAVAGDEYVSLSWNAFPGASYYDVYRSTKAGGEGATPIASSTTPSYIDTSVSDGQTYYYTVTAVVVSPTLEETAPSHEVQATPLPTPISVSLSSSTVIGGASVTGTVNLTNAPVAPVSITVLTSSSSTTVMGPVTLAAGQTTATFTLKTSASSPAANVQVTAWSGPITATTSLQVDAPATQLVVSAPASASEGQPFSVTVTAEDASGNTVTAYGGTVAISSSDSAAALPAPATLTNGVGDFSVVLKSLGEQTVTATDTANAAVTGTSSPIEVTLTSVLYTFFGGVQMISAPSDYSGIAVSDIFTTLAPFATWNPILEVYAMSPTPPADTIRPGVGYWVRFAEPAGLYDIGSHTNEAVNFPIPLQTGWNMIGDPFTETIALRVLQTNTNGLGTVSFTNGASDGITQGKLYTWPAGNAAYNTEYNFLQPFTGYWLYSFIPATIIVPAQNNSLAATDLTATPNSTQIALNWTAGPGATSYNVYRGTVTGGESITPYATDDTNTSYTDTAVTDGTTYYYTVDAISLAGTSAPSNEAFATPVSSTSSVPTNLTATGGNAEVTLSWTGAAGATSYNLYRGTATGGEATTPYATTITTTSYTDTAVVNGDTYYYTVAGVTATGTSAYSNEASATPEATSGSVPTNLTATPGDSQVVLAWTAATGASSYDVYRGLAAGAEGNTPYTTGVLTTSYTDTAVTNGTTYYYTVAGVGAGGTSGFSNEASATPEVAAPTNLTATAGISQVVLTWTASSTATSFNVYRGTTTGGEGTTPYVTDLLITTYTDTAVTNGTTYYYTVASVDPTGTSAPSNEVSATPEATAPAAPTGLTAVAGNSEIALTWTGSVGATSYDVYRSTTSGGEGTTPYDTSTTASYTDTAATFGITYFYTVDAADAAGTSSQSNEASATVESNLPGTPTGVTATAGPSQVVIMWTASPGASTYNLYRSTISGDEGSTPYVSAISLTTYTDNSVTSGTTYFYEVTAANAAGESLPSTEVSATPN